MFLWRCTRCGTLAVREERRDEDGALIQEYHDHHHDPNVGGYPMDRWTSAGIAKVMEPDAW